MMAKKVSSDVYIGPFCDEASITELAIIDSCLPKLSNGPTNGIAFELSSYRKDHKICWNDFYSWIEQLYQDKTNFCPLSTFKVYIGRIEKEVSKLKRNKQHQVLQSYLEKLFCYKRKEPTTRCKPLVSRSGNTQPVFDLEVMQNVNKKLATELYDTASTLEATKRESDKLSEKISHFSVRNVNKRIKRRDDKIQDLQLQAEALEKEIDEQHKLIKHYEKENHLLHERNCLLHSKSEKTRVQSYRVSKKAEENCEAVELNLSELYSKFEELRSDYDLKIQDLKTEIAQLHASLDEKQSGNEQLREKLNEIDTKLLKTKEHKQLYLDNVRQCCLELLSLNVGIRQVEPVIRSVLKNVAGYEVDDLPKTGTLVRMYSELKGLAYQQVAEELSKTTDLTLHSDGTSKFGQHYGSFQISAQSAEGAISAYSLGLSEMVTGSAEKTLDVLKQILDDIKLVTDESVCKQLLASIKNTMSDRHIVQKNFNELLQSYRLQILPDVVLSWPDLSPEEQQQVSSLNNFFCGLHMIVGMADTAASVLCQWEATTLVSATGSGVIVRKSESGTVRLVRTACKALSKHGSEQCGVYQPFTSFLSSHGVSKNPLASFKGNRFNILFFDAGALFFIAPLVKQFFNDVWQTPNQLLRAVLSDIQVPEYLSGCKALGLINKIVTGPLWRVLESSDVSILDMNDRYQTLKLCCDKWSFDATDVLSGDAVLFDDFPPVDDAIFQSLIKPSEYDATAQEILHILFSSLSLLVSHFVEDHLPDGKYDNPSHLLQAETKSVPKTNVVSERDFAQLDRLLHQKPNATTLCLEGMILFANNKTSRWLDSKSQEERQDLLKKARIIAPEFKQLYRIRRQKMLEERSKMLQAKQLQLERMRQKKLKEKEHLTENIVTYGLWQTSEQVDENLRKLKTKKDKVKALKVQLDFRKKVLEQFHSEKDIFFVTKKSKQLPVEVICDNLCKLLNCTQSVVPSGTAATCQSLIGKEILHKWKDEDGQERWYKGRVLSLVPGTTDWFNIKYDGEEDILTLNLLFDIEKGDVDILP